MYLLVFQDEPKVIAYRRKDRGFVAEVYEHLEAVILLPEISIELPLAEIYESIGCIPEPDEDEYR